MHYFEKAGKQNTMETMRRAVEFAGQEGISHLVVASHTGFTVDSVADYGNLKVVVVTSAYGYAGPGRNSLSDEKRAELVAKGYQVCTAAHALSGAERSISERFGGAYPVEVIAHTLRMFGAGTKVCVEIAAMAADAGLIPVDRPVVVVAGSGKGADTALVLRAATTKEILNTKIEKYICKPADITR